MIRWVTGVGLLSLAILGCGGSGPKPPPLAAVAGTVQLAGKPLDSGEITFLISGQAPQQLAVKDGKFDGKAMVGENHIEIRAFRPGKQMMMNDKPFGDPVKENYIAEKYNDRSALAAKVESGGAKDLKFEVESK